MGFREEVVKFFRLEHTVGVRTLVVLMVLGSYITIIITLIVNPKALDPSVNSLINYFLGGLQSAFTTILMFYFPIKKDDNKIDLNKKEEIK